MKLITKTYLGDGVYATFDGFQIELSTERDGRTEKIFLDPIVLANLNRYVENLTEDGVC